MDHEAESFAWWILVDPGDVSMISVVFHGQDLLTTHQAQNILMVSLPLQPQWRRWRSQDSQDMNR
jgi:hypothetical protein